MTTFHSKAAEECGALDENPASVSWHQTATMGLGEHDGLAVQNESRERRGETWQRSGY